MRVGIIFICDDKSGGGFQHQIAILENLKLYAPDCRHKFFVFSYDSLFDTKKLECEHLQFKFVKNIKKPFVLRVLNYALIKLKKIMRIPPTISTDSPMQKAINEYEIELMYYMCPNPYINTIAIPYILTVWDLQHRIHPEFPELRPGWNYKEQFYREAIGKAYAILVDEKAGKEDVIRFYNVRAEKVFVLPYIPSTMSRILEADLKSIQDKYKLYSDYIFYPAQFWPHKNHVAILNALKILKEEYNTHISAVFTGLDEGNLSYIKKHTHDFGITEQILFLGFVPDEDIPALYQGAIALVMPTYFGPSNIPVYEAFAYQCPVITSDIRGIRDQVGEAGLLVDPGDFRALSDAILKLYQDRTLREKLIKNGTKKSLSWTGKDYIDKLIKIIDSFSSVRSCWDLKYERK